MTALPAVLEKNNLDQKIHSFSTKDLESLHHEESAKAQVLRKCAFHRLSLRKRPLPQQPSLRLLRVFL